MSDAGPCKIAAERDADERHVPETPVDILLELDAAATRTEVSDPSVLQCRFDELCQRLERELGHTNEPVSVEQRLSRPECKSLPQPTGNCLAAVHGGG